MDQPSPFVRQTSIEQISFKLSEVEEIVLEQILLAADNNSVLNMKVIADQVPYPQEVVSAAVDKLLAMGLIHITMTSELLE
ncbi:MAG: hypothetical protein AAF685_07905 [Cyanobacteria bacterium P01_C01_bin.89]